MGFFVQKGGHSVCWFGCGLALIVLQLRELRKPQQGAVPSWTKASGRKGEPVSTSATSTYQPVAAACLRLNFMLPLEQ